MVNPSKIRQSRFWDKWRNSNSVGQLLTNYASDKEKIKRYIHPNPKKLELQKKGISQGYYRFDVDNGESVYEERKDLGEKVVDFKGAKLLMAQFYDTQIKKGKFSDRTVVIIPGILVKGYRDEKSEYGLDVSKIAELSDSMKPEVRDLAKRNFPNSDFIWIW
jgi:hypothetical protein